MNKIFVAASVLLLLGTSPALSVTSTMPAVLVTPDMSRGGIVSACGTVITKPGKYWLTQDLYCEPDQLGIHVLSSNVIVDLKGHTIVCDAPNSEFPVGAVVAGDIFDPGLVLEKVRVRNGTVSGCDDGILFSFTESGRITKITSTNNFDAGITLVAAQNTVVRNNVGIDNFLTAIRSFSGVNNEFKRNRSTGSGDSGLFLDEGETGSRLVCNTSEQDAFGIAIGPYSNGNLIRGNYINDAGDTGIGLFGILIPDVFFGRVPYNNVISHNFVQASGRVDLAEFVLDLDTLDFIVFDAADCQNKWRKNRYSTWLGPENCVAPPVVPDDDDVCALDDDDD